jgi:phage gp36-like protein
MGNTVVSTALIEQIGAQVEAEIDAVMRRRYLTPIEDGHPLLTAAAEYGITCQLFSQYQVGQNEEDGSIQACRDYRRTLKTLDMIPIQGAKIAPPTDESAGFPWTDSYGGSRAVEGVIVDWDGPDVI